MTDILFFSDFEEGHLFPSFKIAHNLKNYGYKVAYTGIADAMATAAKEGFDTYPVFESLYPRGYIKKLKDGRMSGDFEKDQHCLPLIQGEMDELLETLKPRLIISSTFAPFEALILHYRYAVPQIIYSTCLMIESIREENPGITLGGMSGLRCSDSLVNIDVVTSSEFLSILHQKGISFKNILDLTGPLQQMPHFMLCPKELEINKERIVDDAIYLGPGISHSMDSQDQEILKYLPKKIDQKIIYASMGSQISAYPEKAKFFFQTMVECMKEEEMSEYHLILSVGGMSAFKVFEQLPENVAVYDWVPQKELLKYVSLAIIHGGLGSVKECIHHEVPMLVTPLGRDQFDNAQRVAYHKLGLEMRLEDMSIEQVVENISYVMDNRRIRERIIQMNAIFQEEENKQKEVAFVRNFIGEPQQVQEVRIAQNPIVWSNKVDETLEGVD